VRIKDRSLSAVDVAIDAELDTAGRMLGLPGFRVLACAEFEGELQVQVETTEDLIGCPSCAGVAALHDRRLRLVRDVPAGGRPVVLCWSKRVWRCRYQACP
jgi:transposase